MNFQNILSKEEISKIPKKTLKKLSDYFQRNKSIAVLESAIFEMNDRLKILLKEKEELKLKNIAQKNELIKHESIKHEFIKSNSQFNSKNNIESKNVHFNKGKIELLDLLTEYLQKLDVEKLRRENLEEHVYNLHNELYNKTAEVLDLQAKVTIALSKENNSFESKSSSFDLSVNKNLNESENKNLNESENKNLSEDKKFENRNSAEFVISIYKITLQSQNIIQEIINLKKNFEKIKTENFSIFEELEISKHQIEKQELLLSKFRKLKEKYLELIKK